MSQPRGSISYWVGPNISLRDFVSVFFDNDLISQKSHSIHYVGQIKENRKRCTSINSVTVFDLKNVCTVDWLASYKK